MLQHSAQRHANLTLIAQMANVMKLRIAINSADLLSQLLHNAVLHAQAVEIATVLRMKVAIAFKIAICIADRLSLLRHHAVLHVLVGVIVNVQLTNLVTSLRIATNFVDLLWLVQQHVRNLAPLALQAIALQVNRVFM